MSIKFILLVAGVYFCYLILASIASPLPQGKVEIHPDCAQVRKIILSHIRYFRFIITLSRHVHIMMAKNCVHEIT